MALDPPEANAAAGQPTLPPGTPPTDIDGHAPTMAFDRPPRPAALSAAVPQPSFGDYELLAEIGRGGMGVVYKARQISLNRIVALKTILAGQLASEDEVKRFYLGAEVAAALSHPGIVPVYEAGLCGGQHYFSMAYVEGQALAARLAGGPLSPTDAAQLIHAVADAVQYAHERGLIHRDLKPGNILVDRDGRPLVTDFDLAKRVRGDSNLTATGQVMGTPSYMPPEQASGDNDRIGTASDVYSLGAVLYELLTGRPPFKAANAVETLIQVLNAEPVPPRLLNPQVPRDLETIVLKCLEKEPERRYPAARELADELGRFLDGEPIQASSVNLLDRLTRAVSDSRHEKHFQGWGVALAGFGLIILVAHVWSYAAFVSGEGPLWAYWLPRGAMVAALAALLWYARPGHSLLPTSAVERPIWAVWIGYLLAVTAATVVVTVEGRDSRALYPIAAALAGVGFFGMGSLFWGGCYVIGLAFLVAAPVLAVYREASVLWFGVCWFAALVTVGIRYWRLGCQAQHPCPENPRRT